MIKVTKMMLASANEQLKKLFKLFLDQFFFQRGEIVRTKIKQNLYNTDNKGYI